MRKLLLFVLSIVPLFAALPTTTVFETRSAGSNNNGGCFITGSSGTDFSQQNAAQYNATNLTVDLVTNTIVTSASHNFVASDVGNCMQITAGIGYTTGWYYIVSVASNAATLDRSPAAVGVTGGTYFVGGALATLAQLNTAMCSGCIGYVKADGTYGITAKVTFNYSSSGGTQINGYTTTRGDNGKPTIQASSDLGDRMIDLNVQQDNWFRNFILDANTKTSTSCLLFLGAQAYAQNIECMNLATADVAITFNNVRNLCYFCYVHDHSGTGAAFYMTSDDDICIYCTARNLTGNSQTAYRIKRGHCYFCVADTVTGTLSDGFLVESGADGPASIINCVVYNTTRNGVVVGSVQVQTIITGCIFDSLTNGINNTSGTTLRVGDIINTNNFFASLSGSNVLNLTAGSGSVSLSADPFTNPAAHNFTLNNVAGGGASVRGAGLPSTLPGVTGTGFPDGGVLQTQSSSTGGGGSVVIP